MKRLLTLLALCTGLTPSVGWTYTLEDIEHQIIEQMKADVGKTFWIERPEDKGIPLCGKRDLYDCPPVANTSFKVLEAFTKPTPKWRNREYRVRTEDGREGFISSSHRIRFLSRPLSAEEHNMNRACEQRGQPLMGMTKDQVLICMGPPVAVNVTETAAGTTEQMIYSRSYVYVDESKVVAIQSLR